MTPYLVDESQKRRPERLMQSNKAMKTKTLKKSKGLTKSSKDDQAAEALVHLYTGSNVQEMIDRQAVALGFPQHGCYLRVAREVAKYCPKRGKPTLSTEGPARPRFLAVMNLHLLMIAAQNLDG